MFIAPISGHSVLRPDERTDLCTFIRRRDRSSEQKLGKGLAHKPVAPPGKAVGPMRLGSVMT